jgi:hypothetical protein
MIYDINLVYFFLRGGVNLGVALYSFQALSAMEFVIKVLHCNVEIVESETLMTFLADDKISENEAIVCLLWTFFDGRKMLSRHIEQIGLARQPSEKWKKIPMNSPKTTEYISNYSSIWITIGKHECEVSNYDGILLACMMTFARNSV